MTPDASLLPLVSVIIPVYNDSEPLRLCLDSLTQQTYPKDRYEIIVVDNNSQEDIAGLVSTFEAVKLAHEPRPGSYLARNTGIKIAAGDIIAFTDADCIAEPDWIENAVNTLVEHPQAGMVAGRIKLFYKDPENPTPFELYDELTMGFPQDQFIENGKFGATANLFTHRNVLDDVGYFDENLKSAGDRQWGRRVYEKGYEQLYADNVCIRHPARYSWADVRKRAVRITGGKYDLIKRTWKTRGEGIKDLLLFLKPPFRSFIRIWTDKRLKNFQQKLQFTIVMLRIRYVSTQERLRLQLGGGTPERS